MSSSYFPELLFEICAQIYSAGLPSSNPSLDPLITADYGIPTSLPSSLPPGSWSEALARQTLANLCLVNHAWYEAAKPWLWRRLEVRLPRSWLSIVEEIAWDYDEAAVEMAVGNTIKAAANAAVASSSPDALFDKEATLKLEESILTTLGGPYGSIQPDLLSPTPSRDPSPRRFRPKSKSPARWKIMKSITDAIRNVLGRREPWYYVPTPHDPRPGRFVRHLDFNHFRTFGMRRSVEESVNHRFVTGARVEAVLKEMPNLRAFGATEYMDGALTLPVLKELFLRGAPPCVRGRPSRGRGLLSIDISDTEEDDRERRQECNYLEAIDLAGCVSAVFVNALIEFVNIHLLPSSDVESEASEDVDRREIRRMSHFSRSGPPEPLTFPGLRRLGMRGVKSILPFILDPFVLSFPCLTHLDLSGTRVTPELLQGIGESPAMRLQSLALAQCTRLTSESIKNFLVNSPVTSQITELNLYGDMTFTSPLLEDDLRDILDLAPCFLRGELVYLDLSSAPLTEDLLLNACKPLPQLRSLGLSHIPDLGIKVVSEFLKTKAVNVEVLTLIGTSPELDCGLRAGNGAPRGSVRQSCNALHAEVIRPLCKSPISFTPSASTTPLTRLRVIELSGVMLGGLEAWPGSWNIVRSKGGRGWYVDTASGWVATLGAGGESELRRDLEPDHPLRLEMVKLSNANGNVSSGVGWHARKMEILHGHGMLGREDGLYGAVSFAYQG